MRPLFETACISAVGLALVVAPHAAAQCHTIDFDDLAVGTVVTNQYDGVLISGRDIDGTSGVTPRIYNPNGTTTSEPQCLSAEGVLGEVSNEFVRLEFDRDQTMVTFTLGVRLGCAASDVVTVRIYSNDAGVYNLRRTMPIPVNGLLPLEHVLVFVRAQRTTGLPFRRIEVEAGAGGVCAGRFELIDDLSFDIDPTPAIAVIDPSAGCLCMGASITGDAYDEDESIAGWTLHARKRGLDDWRLVRVSTTEVINGELGPWNALDGDGEYTLRLKVTNLCGIVSEAFSDVYMDRAFNSLFVRTPVAGAIVGGTICVDGTAWDHCGGDFTVEHRSTSSGGVWLPFDVSLPPWVTTDPLGYWTTSLGDPPDGNHQIRVTANDDCGNNATSPIIPIVIDNTEPTALITSPANCDAVSGIVPIIGVVNDAHLRDWKLYYTGGNANEWVEIPDGEGNANVNGLLATWDTTGLPPCCYTLLLLATDTANIDCGGLQQTGVHMVSVDVGGTDCVGDLNADGVVDISDLALFLAAFGTVCP